MSTLSKKAQKALNILSDGGEFAYRLERDLFTGHTKFQARLKSAEGLTHKGFSFATFHELKDNGFLTLIHSTSVGSYYKLNRAA